MYIYIYLYVMYSYVGFVSASKCRALCTSIGRVRFHI